MLPMEFLKDIFNFLVQRKKFWLAPVIIVLLLLGVLIVIGGGSAIAPFIYTLFLTDFGKEVSKHSGHCTGLYHIIVPV